ncbi:protein kinase [Mycolicibacterium madagascariense]|uniref:non-specific serine/threonine protein kinase n=1 Tax=Mycolicibacterium madagascariense TaxID=212765 RepID=A0A7I7XM10_9MYCO|nr:serine/threonine-protein kinase [Mycolicibacterium madagascariense]MCV7012407.1 serine/threonine protein kinase [Mycolicibacterium madagascariense]BBZ30082.1 protein kinase [Mycolicibacterium madagascariense]
MDTGERYFGDYAVESVAGRGGSATVYRAHHLSTPDRPVALKVLDDHHRDPAHLTRLRREFDFARRAAGPHVVTMYECGPDWLAMQYVAGGTVTVLTSRTDRLLALAQIAGALDRAHALGIVHCDVKPTNILVCEDFWDGGAVLTDFGIARAVTDQTDHRPAHVEASLPYVAPEVLRGQPPSPASDEYALACTVVELLTGAPPFTATTSMALVSAHLNRRVPQYSHRIEWIPRAFDSILAKAMAKTPELRYQSCSEFLALVARAIR